MTTIERLRSWPDPEVGGLYLVDAAVAAVLSVYAVLLTSGVLHTGYRHGGLGASIGVIAMTVPVAWRRRAPVAAAAVLAGGSLLNGVLFGSMVRCGPALPAVFMVGFALGTRSVGARSGAGLCLCAANVVAQAFYDPNLGPHVVAYMVPLVFGFFGLGRVVRSRTSATAVLQRQSVELRRQREETARLSVAADRARLSHELDGMLGERIDHIAAVAGTGRDALKADATTASETLLTIEQEGREVLRRMREIVGALDESPPNEPQPTLAELSALLAQATTANTRLTIEGDPRRLPAGLELSGYRIVEHLVSALEDAPSARITVRLRFEPDAFELHISGPAARDVDLDTVLAAARERAVVHGGRLDGRTHHGLWHARARLPLVSGHANLP